MNQFKSIVLRYPSQLKYGLIFINIFVILMSVRMYINYVSIEDAIQDTINQSAQWKLELAYSENFLINYEKSQYAKYFLQHKNNILSRWEFIVRFEQIPTKITKPEEQTPTDDFSTNASLQTPTQSRNSFLANKLWKIK